MIYLVDDAVDFRFLIQQVFNLFLPQYPVRFFTDGADLMQHIEAFPAEGGDAKPKLIVLDVDMPLLNGIETLERLKQRPDWQTIPVVMMTNRDAHEYMQDCYELGANAFLLKPLDLNTLKGLMTLLCQFWIELNQLPKRP